MIVKDILADLAVESAQPKSKPLKVADGIRSSSAIAPATVLIDKDYKLSDGGGLWLIVNPNGGKWWHFRYRFNGKEGKISLAYSRRSPWSKRAKSVTNATVNSTRVSVPAHRAKKRVE